MANPTANKPTDAVFDSSLGLGSVTQAIVPFTELAGLPKEYKNGKAVTPVMGNNALEGISGSGILTGHGTGACPYWVATGFPHTPNGGDPSVRVDLGGQGLQYLSGSVPSAWASAVQKSIWMVFKHRHQNTAVSGVGTTSTLLSYGTGPGFAIRLLQSNVGVVTITLDRNFGSVALTGVTLTANTWYGILLTLDDTNHVRIVRQYRYVDQTDVTGAGGASTADATLINASTGNTDFCINPCDALALGQATFTGEWYALQFLTGLPSDADFATLYADPVASARGTYTPSGGLTAGILCPGSITSTTAELTWTRATGTGTGGTGAPTYQLYRSADPSFLSPSGTLLYTGTATTFLDTGLATETTYAYRVVATDGSSTVTFPATSGAPCMVSTFRGPLINLVAPGDSGTEGQNAVPILARWLDSGGFPCNWCSRGKSGATMATWSPGIGPCIISASIAGAPTSGTLNYQFSLNGGGTVNSGGIAWNANAAAVQTAVEGMSNVGSGNVLVTGGPYPGTPMTLTFRTAHATDGYTVFTGTNALNNGATHTETVVQQGLPKGNLYDDFITECLAIAAIRPIDIISFLIGTNDAAQGPPSPVSQHTVNLTQWCQAVRAALLPTSPNIKIILHAPPYRLSGITASMEALLLGYQSSIRSAAATVPGVYAGDTRNHRYTTRNRFTFADALHVSAWGYEVYELNMAASILNAIYPAGLGGVTGGKLLLGVGR